MGDIGGGGTQGLPLAAWPQGRDALRQQAGQAGHLQPLGPSSRCMAFVGGVDRSRSLVGGWTALGLSYKCIHKHIDSWVEG